ncbi:hypothetical protein pb186bvf_004145 [Paramecium bursaria]
MENNLRSLYQSIQEVNENYNCRICHELCIQPEECVKCEWLFCQICIVKWKEKKNQCPNRCDGTFNTKNPHRLVKSEIAKIKCLCPHCKQGILYDDVEKHQGVCTQKQVGCIEACPWKGQSKDLANHKSQCQYLVSKECPNCKLWMTQIKLQQHNCFHQQRQSVENISNKLIDFKESQQETNQQLKNQIKNLEESLTALKLDQEKLLQNQQKLQLFNQKLVEQLEQAMKQQGSSPQKQQQAPLMQCGELSRQSKLLKCGKGHNLRFWLDPGKEQMEKVCQSCGHQNKSCRYVCQECKVFFCLGCRKIEIGIINDVYSCPADHPFQKYLGAGIFYCDSCNRQSTQMNNPKGIYCRKCDVDICQDCINKERYTQCWQSRPSTQQQLIQECQQQ